MSNLFVAAGQETEEEQKTPFEWDQMPSYKNDTAKPYHEMMVRFRNQEDLDDFIKRIDQPHITLRSKFTWFPRLDIKATSLLRWEAEE